jgi:hypothetical protein
MIQSLAAAIKGSIECVQSKTKQRSTFIESLMLLSVLDIAFSRKNVTLVFNSFSVLEVIVVSEERVFASSA